MGSRAVAGDQHAPGDSGRALQAGIAVLVGAGDFDIDPLSVAAYGDDAA
ncbi:hypothetical protein [Roseomonas sp. WA12]